MIVTVIGQSVDEKEVYVIVTLITTEPPAVITIGFAGETAHSVT